MISIPICGEQTGNELKLQPLNPTQHWSHWRPWGGITPVQGSQEVEIDLPRDLVFKMLSCLNFSQGPNSSGVPGGRHTLTCPGTQFLGDQHASTCLKEAVDLLKEASVSRRLSHISLPGDLQPGP